MKRRTVVPIVMSAFLLGAIEAAAQEGDFLKVELGVRGFFGEANGRLRKGNVPGGISTNVRLDDDLDASDDATGAAISLTGLLKGGSSFNVQGWQYTSEGSTTVNEPHSFGALTVAGPTSTDVEVRYVSAKMVFGLTKEGEPLRVGLGGAGKVLHWKTEINVEGVGQETLDMRTIYPSAEIEVSYAIGESVLLKAEGGLGMPSYSKKSVEIQNPLEIRVGARISLGALTIEGGYQVFDATLVEHQNQPEENRASVNLSGLYFELAARF